MDEDIKKLLGKNLKLTEEILERTKKINRFVVLQQIFGVIKIFLIAVPIIIGIIYLPRLLEQVLGPYRELLEIKNSASIPSLNDLTPNMLKFFQP